VEYINKLISQKLKIEDWLPEARKCRSGEYGERLINGLDRSKIYSRVLLHSRVIIGSVYLKNEKTRF
jgi:hypothetical protein